MRRYASAIALLIVAAVVPGLAQTWISGSVDAALAAAKKAVEVEPSYYGFDTLGRIQLKLKNYEVALESAEKALALAQDVAKRREGFPTKPYEDRVQKVKDAMAAEKK